MLSIPSLRDRFGKLLVVWMAAILVGLLFTQPTTNPSSLGALQARFIYDLPLQIFAALGLYAILRFIGGFMDMKDLTERRMFEAINVLAVVSVFCFLLGFAFAYVGFVY